MLRTFPSLYGSQRRFSCTDCILAACSRRFSSLASVALRFCAEKSEAKSVERASYPAAFRKRGSALHVRKPSLRSSMQSAVLRKQHCWMPSSASFEGGMYPWMGFDPSSREKNFIPLKEDWSWAAWVRNSA